MREITSILPVDAECVSPDRVEVIYPAHGRSRIVSAYDAFAMAGRIQAAAVRAMLGLDAPATYSAEELARIERMKRVIPD